MEVKVVDRNGKDTGRKVTLNEGIYGAEPNDHAIYLDVKLFLANQRQGTSKAKERAEITGSTRKIKKQKGTGTARAGSIKSPLFKGGGRVFGPRPRSYSFKLNRKQKQLARISALSYKAKNESITVVEDLKFDAPKTKEYISLLANLKVDAKKSMLVLGESDKNVYLSARNLQGSRVVMASEVNTYDIMNANTLVLTESSVSKIENILS